MTNAPEIAPKNNGQHIVFVAYNDVQPLDLFGPYQVFALANREGVSPPYNLTVVSQAGDAVRTDSGPNIAVNCGFNDVKSADTLIIPGGRGVAAATTSTGFVNGIRRIANKSARVCSVCTGAYVLAEAGYLEGRKATTHWRQIEDFRKQFPGIEVLENPIFVNDGHIWTSAGVTAGIDLALALVEQDHGHNISASIASDLVVYIRRPGNEPQSSAPMQVQNRDRISNDFGKLCMACMSEPQQNWSIEKMASVSGYSTRTFQRKFRDAFDVTPAVWLEQIRVRQAKTMLLTSNAKQQDIAILCGFRSAEQMRVAFHRQFGAPPSSLREKF